MSELPDPTNEQMVVAISSQLPEVTDEQVAMVFDAWNTIVNGDPLGTILSDPDTGSIAMRVAAFGIHQWQITDTQGGTTVDRSPTLPGWTVLRAAP